MGVVEDETFSAAVRHSAVRRAIRVGTGPLQFRNRVLLRTPLLPFQRPVELRGGIPGRNRACEQPHFDRETLARRVPDNRGAAAHHPAQASGHGGAARTAPPRTATSSPAGSGCGAGARTPPATLPRPC